MAWRLVLAAIVAWRALKSPIPTIEIVGHAWKLALGSIVAHPKIVVLIFLIAAVAAALQNYFVLVKSYDPTILVGASIAWQALMAVAVAVLAVPFHRGIINVVLTAPRFPGAQMTREPDFGSANRAIMPRAALYGFLIWLLTYGLNVASKATVRYVPEAAGIYAFYAAILVVFVLTTMVMLVRPALSRGLTAGAGLHLARRNSSALLFVIGLLLLVPMAFGPIAFWLPRLLVQTDDAQLITIVSFLIFSVFQVMAMEAATVLFLGAAEQRDQQANAPLTSTVQQ